MKGSPITLIVENSVAGDDKLVRPDIKKLLVLYGTTLRFTKVQVADALLDSGLACSVKGEKLRGAARQMRAMALICDHFGEE